MLYLGVTTSVTLTPNWCGLGNVVIYLSEFGSKTLTSNNEIWDNNLYVFQVSTKDGKICEAKLGNMNIKLLQKMILITCFKYKFFAKVLII